MLVRLLAVVLGDHMMLDKADLSASVCPPPFIHLSALLQSP